VEEKKSHKHSVMQLLSLSFIQKLCSSKRTLYLYFRVIPDSPLCRGKSNTLLCKQGSTLYDHKVNYLNCTKWTPWLIECAVIFLDRVESTL